MYKFALLVVDVQTALIRRNPYNKQNFIENIKRLIDTARKNNVEVIYVRQDVDVAGLESYTDDWDIYYEIAPENGEKVFNKKYNSSFYETGLKEYLKTKGINTVILMGLQTEYCIDATCKSAFEHGFNVIIPEGTNTTFGNDILSAEKIYELFNHKIWNNRFATVLPLDKVEEIISWYGKNN
ncbi:MAG TPA: cysteine hydrolase family protein [Tissierellaceae bacterium]